MGSVVEDYAALVADTLAAIEALRATGAEVVPRGALAELPARDPAWAEGPARLPEGEAHRGARAPTGVSRGPAPDPRGAPLRPAPGEARPRNDAPVAPPRPVPVEARPRADVAPESPALFRPSGPAAPAAPAAAAPTGGAALFGAKWASLRSDPAEELERAVAAAGPRCASCGQAPPRGVGNPRAPLAVVAEPLAGEAAAMFDKMLVHVLVRERADVFVVDAPRCAACRDTVKRQIEIVRPRIVLAMGPPAADLLVVAGVGRWGRWGSIDVLPTFHPDELVLRPADKRAALEHLREVARRLG
jgi:DNA polymerase